MDLVSHFDFRLPYHPKVTETEMLAAAELVADAERRKSESFGERVRTYAGALAERNRKLRELVGGDNYFALQQFKQELRLEEIRNRRPPYGTRRADLKRDRASRIAAFLSERGVDPQAIAGVLVSARTGFAANDDIAPVQEVSAAPSDNEWMTATPPYSSQFTGYSESQIGFRVNRRYLYDPAAGHVGLVVDLTDSNAGDDDYGFVIAGEQVAFWYEAPRAGLVEVIVVAQCGEGRHRLQLYNEWGVSDSTTTQRNMLMMQVHHRNVRHAVYSLASEFRYSGDDDVTLDEQHLVPGQEVQARMISDGPIPPGEPVVISAGCQTEDRAYSNDVSLYSTSDFSWFIKRVHVRVLE
jgi:hypothetical protein